MEADRIPSLPLVSSPDAGIPNPDIFYLKISSRGGSSPNFGSSMPIALRMVGAIYVMRIVCKSTPALISGPHAMKEDSNSRRKGR